MATSWFGRATAAALAAGTLATRAEFTAYNDASPSAGNPPNTTQYGLDQGGALRDFASGATLGATLSIVNNGAVAGGSGGPMPDAGTDAHAAFDGKVTFANVAHYGSATGWWVEARFAGLDPARDHTFATSVNRGGGAAYTSRWSRFTLSGADAAVYASSPGAQSNSPVSVSFCTGENTAAGYVAKWTGIRCGSDGAFAVRVENDGGPGRDANKGYAFDGILLQEHGGGPAPLSVALAAPPNAQVFAIGAAVATTATVAGGTAPYAVQFLTNAAGGAVAAAGPARTTPPYAAALGTPGRGLYEVFATAGDAAGGAATSAVRWFSVVPQPGFGAVALDGGDDHVRAGPAAALGLSRFTIEAWFRRRGTGTTASSGSGGIAVVPLVAKGRGEGDGDTRDCNYLFGLRAPEGTLACDFEALDAGGTNYPVWGRTPVAADGTWRHGAATYDGTNWALYLDGALETNAFAGRTPRHDSVHAVGLGTAFNSTGARAGQFHGDLDEVRLWDHARTAEQIAAAMRSEIPAAPGLVARWSFNEMGGTAARDSGSGGTDGALLNGATWTSGYPLDPAGNEAPRVSLAEPAAAATVLPTFDLAADAWDYGGAVARVAFFADGAWLGEDADPPWRRTWTNAPDGARSLWAVAWDGDGAAATSAVVAVTVDGNLPPAAPSGPAPTNGAPFAAANAEPAVTVSDPNGDALTVVFHGRAAANPPPPPDFVVVAIPDTQCYTLPRDGGTLAMFESQAEWILTNQGPRIAYVAGLGDLTDDGKDASWQKATNVLYRLEDPVRTGRPEGIPYGLTLGNHDEYNGGSTNYNRYFGTNHFAGRSYWGGSFGPTNNTHFDLFSAGGMDFVSLCLEYNSSAGAPTVETWTWVTNVLTTYRDRRAIVVQHDVLNTATRPAHATWTTRGQATYDRVKGFTNVFLILCGHNHGNGRRADTNDGVVVHSLLSDYQDDPNGGDGKLRTYTFSPAGNAIRARTFSPHTGVEYTDADHDFTIPYAMFDLPPFAVLGTNTAVASGARASVAWPGLQPGRTYEWFVTIDDGRRVTTGAVHRFTVRTPSYGAWASDHGLAATGSEGEDADGDGAPNLFEYSQRSDPTNAAARASLRAALATNAALQLRFTRDPAATDLVYIVEATGILAGAGEWTGINSNAHGAGWTDPPRAREVPAGGVLDVTVDDPERDASARFMRLQIRKP